MLWDRKEEWRRRGTKRWRLGRATHVSWWDRLEASVGSPAAGLSHLCWGSDKADGGQSHHWHLGDKGDGGSPVKRSTSCKAETPAGEKET